MNVEYFMQKLSEQTAPMNKSNDFKAKGRQLEKISLNYEGNFGMYQILPFDSVVQDIPFITLYDTKEICVPRMGKAADGSPSPYKTWIKLLPIEGYKMKDSTGRVVSSLTAEEEDMLKSARTLFDQLYEELDVKNNLQYTKDIARKRNYTIFHAFCMNRWDASDTLARSPIRSNFSGLFVCTAKGFSNAVQDNISSKALLTGGDQSFLNKIYNRDLTGRTGFVLFTINKSKTQAGYQVTVQHEFNVNGISSITIPSEDAELMKDPVASFLGWQANKEDENVPDEQRRLFNKVVIGDAINYMTKQLAAIRTAKQTNSDVNKAMMDTNDIVLKEQKQQTTNDPMLQAQEQQGAPNPDFIKQQNTQPFQTPPASKMSPITGEPESTPQTGFGGNSGGFGGFGNSTPFSSPFGNFSNESSTNDLPF